jgi:hypothetical protein
MTSYFLGIMTLAACHASSGADVDAGFDEWTLESLHGGAGFSFRIPAFDVAAGAEVENCYFVKAPDLNNGQPYWVDHVKMAQNPGSHHLSIFRVRTIWNLSGDSSTAVGQSAIPVDLGDGTTSYPATLVEGHEDSLTNPCWLTSNWADWPLLANDQASSTVDPYYDWQLPTDVALPITPGEPLMVQSHYVNSTDQATPFGARVGINFYMHTAPSPTALGTLFATQQQIRICQSNPDVSFSGSCKLPGATTITAANGHFHSRGKEFDMFAWDGVSTTPDPASRFYQDLDWNDPPMRTDLNTPTVAGGGVAWTCTYHWVPPQYETCDAVNAKDPEHQNDCCYTFGGDTDIGEHCNAFVYFYPRGDSDVFCN